MAELNITSLPSFSKKNYFKILKRARVINKNVFSSETLYTHQRVISQLKCVSVMTSCDVFRGKRSGVFHFMRRPFLLFTLAICDLLCWSLLHLSVCTKKRKTDPKKKKKKVFDDEWRKTLADSDKVIMGVAGLHNSYPRVIPSLEFGSNECIF